MTEQTFTTFLRGIVPANRAVMELARKRQSELVKPPGSLGKLEEISIRLAGITGEICSQIEHCRVLVFAADNGVIAEGISSAPERVTLQQTINMTRHITGMSSLARYFGDSVVVVDVGINADVPCDGVMHRKVRRSTGNIAKEPALSRQQTLDAIGIGIEMAQRAKADGIQAVGVGEMGIGNTTTSAAVLAVLTGSDAVAVAGRGGGLTDSAFEKKKRVIDKAIALHHPEPADPVEVLSKVGGLDLAAMTGAFLGCAAERIPVVVDGFISIVAALCAERLCPAVRDFLFLSHASYEIGYQLAAQELALQPFLLLEMRLGEGSGCPLAFQILKGACAVMCGMATFAEASIEDGYLEEIRKTDAFTVKKP